MFKLEDSLLEIENSLTTEFKKCDEVALFNQNKVLEAFIANKVSSAHFNGSTGYGEADSGRDTLRKVFASIFKAEDALVSPHILCGTHALTISLFGILRPGDLMLSIAGKPYDTLHKTILGEGNGSLKDFGVKYAEVELKNNKPNIDEIVKQVKLQKPKLVYLQRSRGYAWRDSICISEMEEIFKKIREVNPSQLIMVDNCYGEFTETKEPTEVGANLVAGSLTKNIGGGLASNGGYVAGDKAIIELIANRLTSPSLGTKVGSFEQGYRLYYQGLFNAPSLTGEIKKGVLLSSKLFRKLGYETLPREGATQSDIVCSIKFEDKQKMIDFCSSIQASSPIESYVTLEPWDMAGYQDKIIMAAGTFIEGATSELSADGPVKSPYIAYVQGGLNYNHVKIALNNYLKKYN